MRFRIEKIKEADLSTVVTLAHEFAQYEKLTEFCEINEAKLRQAMYGNNGFVEGIIAFEEGRAVGYALFYPSFSSFRGERGFYLEDIFISNDFRGHGLGRMMLSEIARIARAEGFERIDFQVLDWNKTAINFYEKLGAVGNFDESHFKFSGKAFENLAAHN